MTRFLPGPLIKYLNKFKEVQIWVIQAKLEA